MKENYYEQTPLQYTGKERCTVYLAFLDHLVNEIQETLVAPLPGFNSTLNFLLQV